jgi:hypothetical protein
MDNQRIAGQYCQPLAISRMNRRLTATGVGIIKAWQVVMNQRSTVQQLNRDCGRCQQSSGLDPTRESDRQTEAWTHASPPRKDGMLHGGCEPRRRLIFALHRPIERTMQGILDHEARIKRNRF